MPINAQPITSITQPMSNVGNQIVQTPTGQVFMVPSYSTKSNSSQGQACVQITSLPTTLHSDLTSSESTSKSAKPEAKTTESSYQPSSILPPNNHQNTPNSTPQIELLQPDSSQA